MQYATENPHKLTRNCIKFVFFCRILHCSLLHFNNYAIGVKVWSQRTLKLLDFIINHYILTWKRAEEERKRREEEADSGIFRYKQKTLSEEEMDCLEILKQFPSHEKVRFNHIFFVFAVNKFASIGGIVGFSIQLKSLLFVYNI